MTFEYHDATVYLTLNQVTVLDALINPALRDLAANGRTAQSEGDLRELRLITVRLHQAKKAWVDRLSFMEATDA